MSHLVARLQMSVATILFCCAANAQAFSEKRVPVDIRQQPVMAALKQLGEQTGLQLLMRVDGLAMEGVVAHGVNGELTMRAALEQLLANTGLTYEIINDHTVRISRSRSAPTSSESGLASQSFRVAEVASASVTDVKLSGSDADRRSIESQRAASQGSVIQEVIVSAQKRDESIQDVPVPVTALSANKLLEDNQLRIQDYYVKVPGLSVTPENYDATPKLTIRGITTGGFSNPTVGVVVDNVPYGASTNAAGGGVAPDIDPSDLARVEVLRGPQGTLYGASSMGGLLHFVTVDPSTDRFSGRVQGGTSSIYNGDGLGYNVRGSVNVPLTESVAIRASGFKRREPGYINDPTLGRDGVNQTDADGGRVSLLWRPSDAFSVKLGALVQDISADGSSYVQVQPGLADLEQSAVRGTGWLDRKFQVYDATFTARIGNAELVAITGYNTNERSQSIDFTANVSGFADAVYQVPGAYFLDRFRTNKLSQEVRVSMPLGPRVEWLIGGFYTHEKTRYAWDLLAAEPAIGNPVGSLGAFSNPTKFSEYAAFTDVTFEVTDHFDIQVGGRQSRNKQTYASLGSGPAFGGADVAVDSIRTEADAFTYLVTPRFKISPDLMVYARLASGYRAGGPNLSVGVAGIPEQYKPDKTQNYEIGVKGNALDRKLTYEASVYYIDWKDLQIQVFPASSTNAYYTNGSRAKSQGIELSFEVRPLAGLTVSAWTAWNQAILTEDLPPGPVLALSDDRLPYSSRFSGNLSVGEELPITGDVMGVLGASVSYVGNRLGVFTPTSGRQEFAAYARTDLRAGVRYDTWTANLFVNNLTDKRAVLAGGVGTVLPNTFTFIQPRTIGFSVAKTF